MATSTKAAVGPEQLRFLQIGKTRLALTRANLGGIVRAKIQSVKYDYFDVPNNLNKDLYSFNVSKESYFDTDEYTELRAKADALEASGDSLAAAAVYTEMLNKSQLSYSVIQNGGKQRFPAGAIVDLHITEAPTVDKKTGEVRMALVVDSMAPVMHTNLQKSNRFSAEIAALTAVATPEPAAEIAAVIKAKS